MNSATASEPIKNDQANLFARLPRKLTVGCTPYALLVFAVLLSYAQVYGNEFLFDDLSLITGNKFLTSWRYFGSLFTTQLFQGGGLPSPFYRPLQSLLYFLIYQCVGPSAAAFHLLNVVLHALNACLLFALGVRLGFQRGAALLASLLWALHPVQTEAVTYMSGTADPLCGVFLLASILMLAASFTRRSVLAACPFFVLALLSKETAAVFPLLVMGLIFYRSDERWSFKTYLKTWPFWLITIFYFLARITLLHFSGFLDFYNTNVNAQATIADRLFTFLATLPVYLQLLVWPVNLHMERGFPIYHLIWDAPLYRIFLIPQITQGLAVLTAILIGIAGKPSQRATPLAWGLLWATALHIPQSGILAPNDALILEHWMYLPTMGLALGLGESLARLSERCVHIRCGPILAGLAALISILLGLMTFEQNKVWRDPETFYTHILDCGEESARARLMLGNVYAEKRQYALAIEQYRRILAVSESDIDAHHNLAIVMLALDHSPASIKEAVQHLERILELDPDNYKADDALAQIYANLNDDVKESEYRAKSIASRRKLKAD